MKIVNRRQLMHSLDGTLFSDFYGLDFHGLNIKTKTIRHELGMAVDFCYRKLIGGIDCNSSDERFDTLWNKTEFDYAIEEQRDGMYDDTENRYAIYSEEEIVVLIAELVANAGAR